MSTKLVSYPLRLFVETHDSKEYWIAQFIDYPECKGSGDTREEAIVDADAALDALMTVLNEDKVAIREPSDFSTAKFNGRVTLRIPPFLHKSMAILASENGISLNQALSNAVAFFLGSSIINTNRIEKPCSYESMLHAASRKYTLEQVNPNSFTKSVIQYANK